MSNCAIVGINWGDEGKGRIVDLLSKRYDYVVRYQGGGNAGHTVINEYGKFALHLIPSGIFRKGVINVLGNGVALDPESLWEEIENLRSRGVEVNESNLKISDRASLLFPWHKILDTLEEERLKDKKYGSTKQGSAFETAINYTKKVWDDLLPYLNKPYLELSNNLAERCVKPFVINRKVFQTSGSEAGAIYTVKLFSIIRTAIINGLDPYRYIKYVLENIKSKSIDDLLPYSKEILKAL